MTDNLEKDTVGVRFPNTLRDGDGEGKHVKIIEKTDASVASIVYVSLRL